jgi:hypothetical protein
LLCYTSALIDFQVLFVAVKQIRRNQSVSQYHTSSKIQLIVACFSAVKRASPTFLSKQLLALNIVEFLD